MKAFERFDLLFGVVTVTLLALVATVLFDRAFTDTLFWIQLFPVIGVLLIVGHVRGPLSALAFAPRMIAWFSIGFTAAAFFALGGALEFSFVSGAAFGSFLALLEFVSQKLGREEDAEDR